MGERFVSEAVADGTLNQTWSKPVRSFLASLGLRQCSFDAGWGTSVKAAANLININQEDISGAGPNLRRNNGIATERNANNGNSASPALGGQGGKKWLRTT